MSTASIGLIGIGLMGTAVARRLLAAGHAVIGYDVDAAKRTRLVELGGVAAGSVAEVARSCPVVVLCVFSTSQVEVVVAGPEGLLGTPGSVSRIAVCTTTCDPDEIAALAGRVAPHGFSLLEVPISGTSSQVERGDGVGLVAGDEAAALEAKPVLDAICPQRYLLGAVGNGGRAKLAINLILGINRAAMAEGIAFAERLGLEPARFLEVARGSAAASQVMGVKGPLMVSGRFDPPLSRVDQSLKDFKLMSAVGRKLGMGLPFANLNVDVLEACVANGEAILDNAIVINEIRRRKPVT